MEIKKITIQKFLKWLETAPADAEFTCNTVKYDRYEFAKLAGLKLTKPKSKKQINKDIEETSYADLEQSQDSGSAEEHGDGDSESTE